MFDRLKEFFRSKPFVTVSIVICLFSLGGMWWVARQTSAYEAELNRVTDLGTETLGLVAMRTMLNNELALVNTALRRTDDNLVVEDNLADNLWYFYSIEGRTGTRLTELRQLNPPALAADETFLQVPYELSASGDFVGISEFLRLLEIGPRLVRITEFSIRRDTGADEMLSLDLSLKLLGRP